MKKMVSVGMGLGLWVALALASLAAQAADTAAANLNRLLLGMTSFQADFEQMVLDSSGTRLQESQGQVALQRPGQFRWETQEPFPQLLVSNGRTLWLYDEDLEQVTEKPLDERIGHTPALLLSGDLTALEESFRVRGPVAEDTGVYDLEPLREESMFSRLRLYFEAGLLAEMQLEDSLGQRTSLLFRNQRINPVLAPELFVFEPPAGVDVITER